MLKRSRFADLLLLVGGVSIFFIALAAFSLWLQARYAANAELTPFEADRQALERDNPQLQVEALQKWRSAYRVTERATGRHIHLPKREVPGAKIRFVDCDFSQIPVNVLVPNRALTACVELTNDRHVLSAYYFENDAKTADLIDFFENQVEADRRFRSGGRGQYEEEHEHWAAPGQFMFSYRVEAGAGFVGYRMVRNAARP
jgi:hypothetical protein